MATGIIEKGSSGLFDNEIEFNGKYATMVRFLKDDIGLFGTFRDAYVLSSIIGFINDRKMTDDNQEKVQAASIFPNELNKRKQDLRFIYDYKNRTFKDDPEENMDIIKSNMDIFNSYACGGIEYLYDTFQNCTRMEDTVDKLYDILHRFSSDVGLIAEDVELPEFEPDFN